MKFGDLLTIAEMNMRCSHIAAYAFKRKYSNHRIVVSDGFEHPAERAQAQLNIAGIKIDLLSILDMLNPIGRGRNKKTYHEREFEIEIIDYKTILKTFNYFGHVISKFKLIYWNTASLQAEFMGELISNFSSESLVDVQFDCCRFKTLEFITKPLVNVKKVTFGETFLDADNDTLPVNVLFPQIDSLHLESWAASFKYFEQHIPQLKHIYAHGEYFTYMSTSMSSLERIVMANPQINSIALYKTRAQFLQIVSAFLPDLQNLTLWYFDIENANISFNNVTTFSVESSFYAPKNLHFPKLINFNIEFKASNFDELRIFLMQHNHLTRFHLRTVDLNDQLFEGITRELPNMTELMLRRLSGGSVSIECVIRLLENHQKLQQFDLCVKHVADLDVLQEMIEMYDILWNTDIVNDCLSIQRKSDPTE